jgi:hypothetical protein
MATKVKAHRQRHHCLRALGIALLFGEHWMLVVVAHVIATVALMLVARYLHLEPPCRR